MYFRSGKRCDRASLIDSFKQIKDRGVRYEDMFAGSWDPPARVREIIEDQIDAEVIFNGVGTVWNGIKLMQDKELALACFKVYNDWMVEFQAYAPERFSCNATLPTYGDRRLPRRAQALRRHGVSGRSSSRPTRAVIVQRPYGGGRPVLGGGGGDRHAGQHPHEVLLPGR